jgi:hypothetical protein
MTSATFGISTDTVVEDLRNAAEYQAARGWASVHWADHKTNKVGPFGALRLAVYGIASYSDNPAFCPNENQRARVICASKALNDYVNDAFSLPYLSDWNAEVCRNTDDAVQLFRSAADYLTRTEK